MGPLLRPDVRFEIDFQKEKKGLRGGGSLEKLAARSVKSARSVGEHARARVGQPGTQRDREKTFFLYIFFLKFF